LGFHTLEGLIFGLSATSAFLLYHRVHWFLLSLIAFGVSFPVYEVSHRTEGYSEGLYDWYYVLVFLIPYLLGFASSLLLWFSTNWTRKAAVSDPSVSEGFDYVTLLCRTCFYLLPMGMFAIVVISASSMFGDFSFAASFVLIHAMISSVTASLMSLKTTRLATATLMGISLLGVMLFYDNWWYLISIVVHLIILAHLFDIHHKGNEAKMLWTVAWLALLVILIVIRHQQIEKVYWRDEVALWSFPFFSFISCWSFDWTARMAKDMRDRVGTDSPPINQHEPSKHRR